MIKILEYIRLIPSFDEDISIQTIALPFDNWLGQGFKANVRSTSDKMRKYS